MSIIDRLGDPEILSAMSTGEKLWGAVVVMIIGLLSCIVVLAIIMYAIKLMHLVFSRGADKDKKPDEIRLDPAQFDDGAVVISCPADGSVTALNASDGARVKAGDTLLILKVEGTDNEIIAPEDGTISKMLVSAGAEVRRGQALVIL